MIEMSTAITALGAAIAITGGAIGTGIVFGFVIALLIVLGAGLI